MLELQRVPEQRGPGGPEGGERKRRQEHERQRREANQLRRRLRKQLTLLKDVITRDVLLTKNLHSLREYLQLNPRSSSHNLVISASHASLCFVFGIVRVVHLGRPFHNFLWVHLQLNIFHCDSLSPLSDLSITHHSPHLRGGQERQRQGWYPHNNQGTETSPKSSLSV
jgi:hypothetical protein